MDRVVALKTQVETSIARDRVTRYRGILKLHTRDKKLQFLQATRLRSTVSRKLASLEVDVKSYREIINDLTKGDKQRTSRLLSDYRELCLASNQLLPSEICETLCQDCEVKRRLLDKLFYEKKKRLKEAIKLQLEYDVLSNEYKEQSEEQSLCEQQRLVAQSQQSISKYDAAKSIHFTYCSILSILKKDVMFFNTLLNILKKDQTSQCKAMLRVTVMGQLAAENLDDLREKYKRMTRVVLQNMRVREQMLTIVRCQMQDLWAYAQSLVRVESDTVFVKKDTVESSIDKILENQLINLKDIYRQVKETLLVRSRDDLLARLTDQSKQKERLLTRLNINIKNRDALLNKTNHAIQVLEGLRHFKTATVEQYKTNGCEILEQIEVEKKRERDFKEQKQTRGELFTNIRAALLSINATLFHIKQTGKSVKKTGKEASKNMRELGDREDIDEREMLLDLEEVEADVMALLAKINKKVGVLFAMSNFELDKEKENKARNLYQTYVSHYNSNLIFGKGEEESIGLLVEHETIDPSIPTRADIKFRSRQIIETHLKPE